MFEPIALPYLSAIPLLGSILFNHTALLYGVMLLVPVAGFVLYRTKLGPRLRAVLTTDLSFVAASGANHLRPSQ
ncbi:hypothetical protein [Mesorhizobium sp. KR1-2]|uniref:hypothetical protein n=1 Tax=Mesorhizobium sp. KR1-2 TaxID=3156609 RepID=UPI0032B4268D